MPRSTPYFFETTVFDASTGAEGAIISVPAKVLRQRRDARAVEDPFAIAELLGLRLGVRVPSPQDLPEVFFASLVGRSAPFDEGSFERWRVQRQAAGDESAARFAEELATMEFVAVEESPLDGASLTSLATRGASFVVGGADLIAGHPLRGLAILIVGQFGFVVAQAVRGVGEEAYLISRYHARRLRRVFGVPEDWEP